MIRPSSAVAWLVLGAAAASAQADVFIVTVALPPGREGTGYSAQLLALGGDRPYRWSVTQGDLPGGLRLNGGSGVINGVPTSAGLFNFTVRVRDDDDETDSRQLSIRILSGTPVSITTGALSPGVVGRSYSQQLAASGGEGGYRWAVASGSLPAGLALDDGSGIIGGTPTSTGSFSFSVRVTDSFGGSGQKTLGIEVAPVLAVAVTSLPQGMVGAAYSQALAATGGTPPYTWTVDGTLPPGLALSGSTIAGRPTQAGAFAFTVRVSDGQGSVSRQLSITIRPPPLEVTTATLPAGTVGAPYSQQLAATGGTPPYTWAVQGALPPGLALSGSTVAGTPTQAGAFAFTVRVSDGEDDATRQLSITIRPPPLELTTASPATGTVGAPYSQQLAATGGTPPYTWAVQGALPPGLALSGSTIAGTPTQAGTFAFAARVSDGEGNASRQLSITIQPPPLEVTTATLPGGTVGAPYSQQLAATGGTPPYTWAVQGTLPPGLALSGSTIAGTPTQAGNFAFTVRARDGQDEATRQLAITIQPPPLEVTTASLAAGAVGAPYSQQLAATGGTPPYAWAVQGALPPGLALSGSTIAGTPTQAGAFAFTVQVSDGQGSATRQLSITIGAAPLTVLTESLGAGTVGVPYSQNLAAGGGTQPYRWAVNGALPPGLALSGSTIAGVPTETGTFRFTVEVSDGNDSAARELAIAINAPALQILTTSLPAAAIGLRYSHRLVAQGGSPPYRWTVEGALPPGLTLSGATIAGTPTAAGTFAFIVHVSDNGSSVSAQLSVTVNAPELDITTAALPAGTVGVPYSATLEASGGAPPYVWTVEGSLPPGLTLSGAEISGTPVAPGTFLFTAQVTDGQRTASRQLSITIQAAPLEVMTASLAPGTVGVPYSQTLSARGGAPPYTWRVGDLLPPGLALDAAGSIGGTPASPGDFPITLRVTDSTGATASKEVVLGVRVVPLPAVSINGGAGEIRPLEQPAVGVVLADPYPAALTGELILTFEPDAAVPVDDPAVQFITGGRVAPFTIPANADGANFAVPAMAFQTGSVAGTVTLRIALRAGERDLTPAGGAARVMRIPRTGPSIRSASVTRTAAGFEVRLVGLAPGRELASAAVRLTPAPASDLRTVDLTVPLAEAAARWYQNPAAAAFGSQFSLVLPFTVQGNTASIAAVTVTLTNTSGVSEPVELPLL